MELYIHYINNNSYVILDYCEIQEDDVWVEAVIYREFGYTKKYCRSKQEFFEKFKLEE